MSRHITYSGFPQGDLKILLRQPWKDYLFGQTHFTKIHRNPFLVYERGVPPCQAGDVVLRDYSGFVLSLGNRTYRVWVK